MTNLFSASGPPEERLRQLAEIIRREADLTEEDAVSISEIRCSDPGCPPHGTTIKIQLHNGPGWEMQVPLPVAAIMPGHIRSALKSR
jgi:hypothetical protein